MEKGLVTIVLPIYNVEKYLERCMESVVNQTYSNLEIIMVDDGSPDNCPQMCDTWARKDKRVKVIHKKNAGQGRARNTGIENATGEYICFFDSDDCVELNLVENTLSYAKKYRADFVMFGFERVSQNEEVLLKVIPCADKDVYEGKEIVDLLLPDMIGEDQETKEKKKLSMSLWTGLYSMSMISESSWRVASEREIIAEDVYSLLELMQYMERVLIIPKVYYRYYVNAESTTHKYREDRYEKIKYFYDKCVELADRLHYPEQVRIRLAQPYISFVIGALKIIAVSGRSKITSIMLMKKILKDPHLKMVLKDYRMKTDSIGKQTLLFCMKNGFYNIAVLLASFKARNSYI